MRIVPELPKSDNSKGDEPLCSCHPVCKQRRRMWKGKLMKTSEELLIERRPKPDCIKRRPTEVKPNGPCPLHLRSKHMNIVKRGDEPTQKIITICETPIHNHVNLTYLQYMDIAKRIGALQAVKDKCAFCSCCKCCSCVGANYVMRDAERELERRNDMRAFDKRVKSNYMEMKIMYDI